MNFILACSQTEVYHLGWAWLGVSAFCVKWCIELQPVIVAFKQQLHSYFHMINTKHKWIPEDSRIAFEEIKNLSDLEQKFRLFWQESKLYFDKKANCSTLEHWKLKRTDILTNNSPIWSSSVIKKKEKKKKINHQLPRNCLPSVSVCHHSPCHKRAIGLFCSNRLCMFVFVKHELKHLSVFSSCSDDKEWYYGFATSGFLKKDPSLTQWMGL